MLTIKHFSSNVKQVFNEKIPIGNIIQLANGLWAAYKTENNNDVRVSHIPLKETPEEILTEWKKLFPKKP